MFIFKKKVTCGHFSHLISALPMPTMFCRPSSWQNEAKDCRLSLLLFSSQDTVSCIPGAEAGSVAVLPCMEEFNGKKYDTSRKHFASFCPAANRRDCEFNYVRNYTPHNISPPSDIHGRWQALCGSLNNSASYILPFMIHNSTVQHIAFQQSVFMKSKRACLTVSLDILFSLLSYYL